MRVATRTSELAAWQARYVATRLEAVGHRDVHMVPVTTAGDRDRHTPLHQMGGKGVFVKEVQAAVLDGKADLAVHSAKDMPAISPDGLALGAVPLRSDPRDVLVGAKLGSLRAGSIVATGSMRRRAELARLVPGVRFAELRGNIATRLARVREFDAIVVAAAALRRLDLNVGTCQMLGHDEMIPQVGQGTLAVECRADDAAALRLIRLIDDPEARLSFEAERGFLAELGGDCTLPAGAFIAAGLHSGAPWRMHAFLSSEDLRRSIRRESSGEPKRQLGVTLARRLRAELLATTL